MKRFKKALAIMLSVVSACSLVACNQGDDDIGTPPDYSASQLQMDLYGYHSISDGKYTIDGVVYDAGEDFRTVDRFKEYLDCGMNMVFLQGPNAAYEGGDWETSSTKKFMDMFAEAGATRVIFQDVRLYNLSALETPLIGDDQTLIQSEKQFATQEDLENYVASCLDDYADHSAFYGILLRDEPTWRMFDASAAIYNAVKKYDENIFVKQNLLPLAQGVHANYTAEYNTQTLQESYELYLRTWQQMTNADYIMFDDYPIRSSGIGSEHIMGLKLVADICKEKDLSLYVVAQAMEMMSDGRLSMRECTKADMYWQLNMLQGFGVKRIAYFTYWRRRSSNTSGEFFVDGASFMTSAGEKTDLYYYMTDIHKEIQNFAPTLLSFDYNACAYYMKAPMAFPAGYLGDIKNEPMSCIKNVSVEQSDLLLVTEMIDKDKGNYMYMLQNIMDPARGLLGDTVVHTEVEFDSKYNYVAVYYKGEVTYHKLNNHKYSTELSAGYAEFVIPYV